MKQLRGVNEKSNGDRIIFKHCKHESNSKQHNDNSVIRWQWQHGFYDE